MIISIDIQFKYFSISIEIDHFNFDKIQHLFVIKKNSPESGHRGQSLNIRPHVTNLELASYSTVKS